MVAEPCSSIPIAVAAGAIASMRAAGSFQPRHFPCSLAVTSPMSQQRNHRSIVGVSLFALAMLCATESQLVFSATLERDQPIRNDQGLVALWRVGNKPLPAVPGANDIQRAEFFLAQHKRDLLDADTPLELAQARIHRRGERNIVRTQQTFDGIPVRGGGAIVHLVNGSPRAMRSNLVSGLGRIKRDIKVDAQRAREIAVREFERTSPAQKTIVRKLALEFVNPALLKGHGVGAYRLAWLAELIGPAAHDYVWLDAQTGALIYRYRRIAQAFAVQIADNAGVCVASPVDAWNQDSDFSAAPAHVAEAFENVEATYNYFLNQLAQDGLHDPVDGSDKDIVIVLNECADRFTAAVNGTELEDFAAWNGVAMFFSAGAAAAEDIVGHEYTHAVIDEFANFEMSGQSGALAEAYADIYGELVDLQQRTDNDSGDTRWEFGEDGSGGPYRNLMTPSLFNQPDRMTDSDRYYCGFDADVAIHTNGGVVTHAFALLVDGGTHNGVTVTGIGAQKAAQIFFRALTDYLGSSATFRDAYDSLLAAADDLITESAITASDKAQLAHALHAVELNTPPCSTQIAYCPVGYAPQMSWFENFETTTSTDWTTTTATGVNHWGSATGTGTQSLFHEFAFDPYQPTVIDPNVQVARRGTYGLWADGARYFDATDKRRGDSSVAMTRSVNVPAAGAFYLQFESRVKFEMGLGPDGPTSAVEPDGGVIEYSTDSGSTWSDAGNLIVAGYAYSGTIQLDAQNPLAGRNAFVGMTDGYVSTQLDLSSLAGQSVRFRFRVGTDYFGGNIGWFVDDIAVYSCVPSQLVVRADSDLATSESGASVQFTVALAAQPASTVVVSLQSSDPSEGQVNPSSLTFNDTNWNVPQTVTVTGVNDSDDDGTQSYQVTVAIDSTGDPSFQSSASVTVSLENADDDKSRRGGGVISPFSLVVLGIFFALRMRLRRV